MKKHARGVTLVEMIVTIVVLGIVAGMISMFIRVPVDSYLDAGRRARLTDAADLALRRMTRELRLALPNSVRVTTDGAIVYMEFMLTREGGFYRAQPTAVPGTEDILDFEAADASFQVFASANMLNAADWIAISNLGPGSGSDAYAGDNIARVAGFNAATGVLTLNAAKLFPVQSPDQRFQVVTDRVTYACDTATGQLRRHAGYGIVLASAAQPTPPVGSVPSLMVDRVLACTFVNDANVSNVRTGIVSLSLTLGEAGENVTLFHQVHVSNAS